MPVANTRPLSCQSDPALSCVITKAPCGGERAGRSPVDHGKRGTAVVYHCAMPPFSRWVELFPPVTQAVIEGASLTEAKLVFADEAPGCTAKRTAQ